VRKASKTITIETIEEHLKDAETAVKRKRKTAGDDAGGDDDDEHAALESESDEEPRSKKNKTSGSKDLPGPEHIDNAKEAKEAQKNAAREAKKTAAAEAAAIKKNDAAIKKHNAAVQGLATRAVSILTSINDNLVGAQTTIKADSRYPDFIQDGINEVFKDIDSWLDVSRTIMKNAHKFVSKNQKMSDLPFTSVNLGKKADEARQQLKTFNKFVKALQ